MNSKYLITFILNLIFIFNDVFAGAWVQKKNGYYLNITASYLFTRKEFNHKGEKRDILEDFTSSKDNSFRDVSFTAYLEYGPTNSLTLIANLPFKVLTSKWISTENYFRGEEFVLNTRGFADFTLSAKYALIRDPFVISIQEGVILPLGYDLTPNNDGPRLGNGEIQFESNLMIGKSLYPFPLYISGGIGYRVRGGDLHDEILYSAEVGITLESVILKIYLDGVKSTTTPPDLYGRPIVTPIEGGGGVIPDILFGDQDYLKISPSIIHKFNYNFSIQAELTNIALGKNTISGTGFSLGLIMEH